MIIDNYSIDRDGLSKSIKSALEEMKVELYQDEIEFIFDGNTTFGVEGIESMIRADDSVDEVSAVSILAKVTRDRLMIEYSNIYQEYSFDRHKGYCTKAHLEAIARYGLVKYIEKVSIFLFQR